MKTPFFVSIFLVLFLNVSHVFAEDADKNLRIKLDSISRHHLDEASGGGVVGVLRDGQPYFVKAYGPADAGHGVDNSSSTIFDIASVSKQFTAFAILLLEQSGKLSLDDEINKYLEWLPDFGHEVTIRQLLHHSSGIPSTDVLRLVANIDFDKQWTQSDEIQLITRYPKLNFEPGSEHVYSNAGYSLLAEIVEIASGKPFPAFIKETIFEPLGMKTAFVYDGTLFDQENLAKGYRTTPDGLTEVGSLNNMSYGGGNIFASLEDMLIWAGHFFAPELCHSDLIHRMFTPDFTLTNGDTVNYTYGLYIRNHKGVKMVEHSGGVHGFRSQFMLFPEENVALVVMANNESVATRRLANALTELILEGKLQEIPVSERVEISLPADRLQTYEGSYSMPDGMTLSFALENDTFWLVLPDDARFQLFAESSNSFFLKAFNAQCTFVVGDGKIADAIIWHQGGKDYNGQRLTQKEPLPDGMPESLAGTYVQKEFGSVYEIELEDGRLKLILPETFRNNLGFGETMLNHISGMQFSSEHLGMISFTLDADSGEVGFVMDDLGRLRNISFVKVK